jgi:hypothetical protein
MPNHNAAVPSPELFDKENKVLELRRAGLTWQRIAEEVGYADHTGAYAAYKRALKRTQQQPADELRFAELDRIDRLQLALWPKAMKGDNASVNTIVRLMERRARLLGLDTPIKVQNEVMVLDGGDLDERVRQFAYLIAEARIAALGHSDGEQTVLEISSEAEPITAGEQLADLDDSLGSRMGQDENGRGMDSLASPESEEDPLGGSSQNLG